MLEIRMAVWAWLSAIFLLNSVILIDSQVVDPDTGGAIDQPDNETTTQAIEEVITGIILF